ncbi:MAG: type 4a pilus biogenesis protein PilO [Bryobacterales bacterium]|nr:type 4a pilus biogenesis protein PilO [Bryobacterales bacterium]
MPRNSKLKALQSKLAVNLPARPAVRDPRNRGRIIVGVLLLANIVAGLFAFRPWAETPLELEQQIIDLRKQAVQRRAEIERLKVLVSKSETARVQGDKFLAQFFLGRRTAASTLISELNNMAKASGIKTKEHSFAFEPVEGTDAMAMMTITANYEGSYADLIQYVNRIDRSPRFFIVERLAAAPQQGNQGVLNINMKVNIFVRDDSGLPAQVAKAAAPPAAGAEGANQ